MLIYELWCVPLRSHIVKELCLVENDKRAIPTRRFFNMSPVGMIHWNIHGIYMESNMYIPVYHTTGDLSKNMIGMVKNRLVGMAL